MENNQLTYKINIKLSVVLVLMLPATFGMFSLVNAQTDNLYGIIGNNLVIIDETTGNATLVGSMDSTLEPIENLAYDPINDNLYAIANFSKNPKLISIDRSNGMASIIGDINFPTHDVGSGEGLAFNSLDGKLYASLGITPPVDAYNSNRLSTLNNISITALEATQQAIITGTCENEADALEFNSNILYMLDSCNNTSAVKLYTINYTSGISTFIGDLSVALRIRDLAWNRNSNKMYGATSNPTKLAEINVTNGNTTAINLTNNLNEFELVSFSGIAYAPAPVISTDPVDPPNTDTPSDPDDSNDVGDCDIPCDNKKNKVLVCHIPPGNSDNKHEICINKNALKAHLAHGDYCGPCQVKESALGIEQLEISEPNFSIYPNPFKDTFFININKDLLNKNLELKLYDILGRTVLIKRKINKIQNEINLRGMKNGLYIYSLHADNGTNLTGKIIKN